MRRPLGGKLHMEIIMIYVQFWKLIDCPLERMYYVQALSFNLATNYIMD